MASFFNRVLAIGALLLAATSVSAEPLRVAFPSGVNGQLAKVIDKAGIARKHGFEADFHFFQYGPPMIEALAAGEVDVIFTSLNPVAPYLAKKPGALPIIADVGHASHSIVVRADSPVHSLADLKGKTLAVSFNSDLHVDVVNALKEVGLKPGKDVNLINIAPLELVPAFDQKAIDAVSIRAPSSLVLTKERGARVLAEFPFPFVVAARKEYLDAHPGVTERLRQVLREGLYFIARNPEQAAQWWAEQLRLKPDLVRAAADLNPLHHVRNLEALQVAPGPEFKARAAERARQLVDAGIAKEVVTYVFE